MKNDAQLKYDVEQELRWEPSIDAEQVGVSAKNGVVELDGQVDSYYEKWAAERAAMRVADVKAVASDIKVELSNSASRTDEDIARAAMDHLKWDTWLPSTVKVKVTDGFVTLQGNVEWQYQKDEVERVVRPLVGVKGVINEITLNPSVSASGVKTKIEEALKRNAEVDASRITVEASDGMVTLRGKVRSWAEREEAEHTAYSAPGVSKVDDRLVIEF